MRVEFATCERSTALEFIKRVYPSKDINDSKESAGPLLDFVEKDMVRIQDPMMHGSKINVIAGKNWVENEKIRNEIVRACKILQK